MPSQHDVPWLQLSEFIGERLGLHFPSERWGDLQRGLAGAAQELGFADAAACADRLLSAPPNQGQLQVLASHLTIGETYFFRDKPTFQVLAANILPDLIRARRGREQRLRLWSAACCTGEEPYSLAILLHQLLPDLRDWQVTITATDINARFLQKAGAGTYGAWSFRDAPGGIQECYFRRTADGRFAIIPEIKRLVTFAHLNLVDDVYPSLANGTNAMDLIFCRNVLMYLSPFQAPKVVRKLHHALVEGGWLVVSPSEASPAPFHQFVTVNYPGVILHQKNSEKLPMEPRWPSPPLGKTAAFATHAIETGSSSAPAALLTEPASATHLEKSVQAAAPPGPRAVAESLYGQGRYAEAVDTVLSSSGPEPEPWALSLLARALANQGDLANALAWCERWIAAAKLDPAAHYLHAVVLLEQGDFQQARTSLQRAVYLDSAFVLAHFALGTLARSRGRVKEADRHFANTLDLLRRYHPERILPGSDDLAAGRLTETVNAMTGMAPGP